MLIAFLYDTIFVCHYIKVGDVMIDNKLEKELKKVKLPNVYKDLGKEYYLDPIRQKLILKTPEETVRQSIIQYLLINKKVPKDMIQVEMLLSKYQIKSNRRADIIVERLLESKKEISTLAVIECKSPDIFIGDNALDQVSDYAAKLNAEYVWVTNGLDSVVARYDFEKDKYIDLIELPDYQQMLNGLGDIKNNIERKKRFSFEELEENKNYYCEGYTFDIDTPTGLLLFLTNFFEYLTDISHKMPIGEYKHFKLIEDYGIRYLSCGTASGGTYDGDYRSFLIEYKGNVMFVNLSFFNYGTHTILTVSSDRGGTIPHNSLQYNVNHIVSVGTEFRFSHNGSITVGKKGRCKNKELVDFIKNNAPELLVNDKIYIGALQNNKLLYLDQPEMINFIERILTYALLRDEFREMKLKNIK